MRGGGQVKKGKSWSSGLHGVDGREEVAHMTRGGGGMSAGSG
jgi:hypothetical protein